MKVYLVAVVLLVLSQAVASRDQKAITDFKRSLHVFTAEMYNKVANADGMEHENIFFSPTSIAQTIGMILTGAAGETERELRKVLSINEARSYSTHNLNKLFRKTFNKVFNASRKHENQAIMANCMFYQDGYEIFQDYRKNLTEFYEAGSEAIDFGNPSAAAEKINGWIATTTEGFIDDLISEDSIDQLTRMILVNALYFKAKWMTEMERTDEHTKFGYSSDSNKTADYMKATARLTVGHRDSVTYVSIPYLGEDDRMLIMMPDTQEAFEEFTDRNTLLKFLRNLDYHTGELVRQTVTLTMPMFEFEQRTNMKKTLDSMGVKTLFDPARANLENIAEEKLYVSDFQHKAKISVDEKGTEAAAASAAIVSGRSAPRKIPNAVIDKPFLFAILRQGYVLFFGKVVDPQFSSTGPDLQ